MANGYASSPSGNGTDEASVNAFIIGARYRLPQVGRFEAGISLQGGAALNWNYKADVAIAPNGFSGAVWTLDFLVGGQVDCMYLMTENVRLDCMATTAISLPTMLPIGWARVSS